MPKKADCTALRSVRFFVANSLRGVQCEWSDDIRVHAQQCLAIRLDICQLPSARHPLSRSIAIVVSYRSQPAYALKSYYGLLGRRRSQLVES